MSCGCSASLEEKFLLLFPRTVWWAHSRHWWIEQVSQKRATFGQKLLICRCCHEASIPSAFGISNKYGVWRVLWNGPLPPQRVSSFLHGLQCQHPRSFPDSQALANPTSFLPMGETKAQRREQSQERYHHWSDNDGMKRVSEFMKTNHSTELNQAYSSTEKVVKEVGDVIWKCIV